jgi:hypothetical protein
LGWVNASARSLASFVGVGNIILIPCKVLSTKAFIFPTFSINILTPTSLSSVSLKIDALAHVTRL